MKAIIKEAHDVCRKTVPITSHKTPAGRTRLGKDRTAYLSCIRDYIQKKVKEVLKAKGYPVA